MESLGPTIGLRVNSCHTGPHTSARFSEGPNMTAMDVRQEFWLTI